MEKKYMVTTKCNFQYKTYEEAEKVAKQYTAKHSNAGSGYYEYVIAQAVAVAVSPVPEIEIVKF